MHYQEITVDFVYNYLVIAVRIIYAVVYTWLGYWTCDEEAVASTPIPFCDVWVALRQCRGQARAAGPMHNPQWIGRWCLQCMSECVCTIC